MSEFELLQLSDGDYVVFGLSHARPDCYADEVEEQLRLRGFRGCVFFDLLLANGPKRRVFRTIFDGTKLQPEAFQLCSSSKAERTSATFIARHPEVLDAGVLSRSDIEVVRASIGIENSR